MSEELRNEYHDPFIHHGRMSVFARERIHKDFKLGMPIRDIALKYGILPERAKAIAW